MNASFEEKSTWIQLGSVLVALGAYALWAAPLLAAGESNLGAYLPVFVGTVVLLIVALVVGHLLALLTGQQEERDERDRLVVWRSESASSWVLVLGILAGIAALVFSLQAAIVANALLLSLFLSQGAKYVVQLKLYRRGF